MENASKALIIAGAILLAILIIGLGMVVYTRAQNALDTSTVDSQKVQAYNSTYENYFGTTISGAQVKALADAVRAHNNATGGDPSLTITIHSEIAGAGVAAYSTPTQINTFKRAVQAGVLYEVDSGSTDGGTDGYNGNTGYLEHIFVKVH